MKTRMFLLALMMLSNALHAQNSYPPQPNTSDQEAHTYSRTHGTTLGEAERRLQLQEELGSQVSKIRDEFKDTFAGMYLDNGPDYRIVVRLKGGAVIQDRLINLPSGQIKVAFKGGASATREELLKALEDNKEALRKMIPEIQGTGIDERTGEIVIYVHAPHDEKGAFQSERSAIQGLLKVPVRIEVEETKEENLSHLFGGARYRTQTEECTTGFSVYSEPVYAVTTAGHCQNQGAFYINYHQPGQSNYVETNLPSALIEWNDSTRDFQIHSIQQSSGNYVDQWFYKNKLDNVATVKSVRLYADTMIGMQVCHMGASTGYSCGEVSLLDVDPGSCPNGCANTWVQIGGSYLACYRGDSGGPAVGRYWEYAYGLVKSARSTGMEAGDCQSMTYMPVDRMIESGVSVLTDG